MFSRHHRKVRVLFALSDIVLTGLAFEAAYQARMWLERIPAVRSTILEHEFFLTVPIKTLLIGCSLLVWVALGYWLSVYGRLDAAQTRIILRDTFRQCALGIVALVLFEFLLRLDLSRRGSSPRVNTLERIASERPSRYAAQQSEIELLHGEVLELIHQHSAEVGLIKLRNRWDAEKALRMPQDVVVVELIGLLTRTLDPVS